MEDRQLRQDLDRADRVRLARRSLLQDARSARRHLWLNVAAGAAVTPRVLRYWMYRQAGVETATPNIFSGSVVHGRSPVRIGERTFINHGCYFEANAPITIGEECSIGMEVLVVTSSHPLDETGRFSTRSTYLPVTIGNRCWIGARAVLLPGVTIGDDVIVASGAVVTRDCADAGLYAGVPARRVRDLGPTD